VVPDQVPPLSDRLAETAAPELTRVFHRLNNQLGVILANAELLEARLADPTQKARAGQVVTGALEAISVVQDLRRRLSGSEP
jgi:hypothetical protein